MRPRAKVAFLILLTAGGILPLSLILNTPLVHGMIRFSSYSDLQRFLLTRGSCVYGYTYQGSRGLSMYGAQSLLNPGPSGISASAADQSSSTVSSTPSHSETNNQVNGVDELDTVKTDGQYIYTVTNNTVTIVRAYPTADARLVSRVSVSNQTIDGIFVKGDRLSIISEAPRTF